MAFPDKGISTLIHVDCITLFSQKNADSRMSRFQCIVNKLVMPLRAMQNDLLMNSKDFSTVVLIL